ncbi:hypothetical protein EJB05_50906, partial [Eragrostis curvula]
MELRDLDFQSGLDLQAEVWRKLGLPINFSVDNGLDEFYLLASFGRCKFRLTEENVGVLLQVALGGFSQAFKVTHVQDRVFCFSVSSKKVGFYIYNLRSYQCSAFKVYFNLWGNGGAHWSRESTDFDRDEQNSWQLVQGKKKKRLAHSPVIKKQFVPKAKADASSSTLTGANRVPVNSVKQSGHSVHLNSAPSVFDRIQFPKVSVFSRLNSDDLARNMNQDKQSNRSLSTIPAQDQQNAGKQKEISQGKGKEKTYLEAAKNMGIYPKNMETYPENLAVHSNFEQVERIPEKATNGPRAMIQHFYWGEWLQNDMPDAAPAAQENHDPEEHIPEDVAAGHDFDLNVEPEIIQQNLLEDMPLEAEGELNGIDLNVPMEEDIQHQEAVQAINEDMNVDEVNVIQQEAAIIENNEAMNMLPGEAFLELNDLLNNGNEGNEGSQLSFQVSDSIHGGISAGSASSVNSPVQVQAQEDLPQVVLGLEAQGQNHIGPFLPLDVQIEDLVGEEAQNNGNQQQEANNFNLNLQVGMVQVRDAFEADPVFEAFYSSPKQQAAQRLNADCYRFWARHFSLAGSNDPKVTIPNEWVSFMLSMLMSPQKYEWTKSILISKAWEVIKKYSDGEDSMLFNIPNVCPLNTPPKCQLLGDTYSGKKQCAEIEKETSQEMSTPLDQQKMQGICSSATILKEKYGCTAALVETEVRRSNRIKKTSNGFKQSTCRDKHCYACNIDAPSLSPSIIKNLGTEFCNLSPEKVTDAALKKKRKAKTAVGQKEKSEEEEKAKTGKRGKKLKVSTKKIQKKSTNEDKNPKNKK